MTPEAEPLPEAVAAGLTALAHLHPHEEVGGAWVESPTGQPAFIPLTNALSGLAARTHWEPGAQALLVLLDQLDRREMRLVAWLHTHPPGRNHPSRRDVALSGGVQGPGWPGVGIGIVEFREGKAGAPVWLIRPEPPRA